MSDDPTPHPDVRELLDELEAGPVPPLGTLSVEGARALHRDLFAAPDEPEPVGEVRDLAIPGPAGDVPIRVYAPDGEGPFPVLVYVHGGGWVLGDIPTTDPAYRALTNAADCAVVAVEYRRAPEHPFPAPLEDCYAALRWTAEHAADIGCDPDRIAVGGDSAGGTLAAAAAQVARDRDGPSLVHQLLIYPATDRAFDTDAYEENAEGYFLTREDMRWFWDRYLESDLDAQNPYASPLRAREFADLPPATVVTAGFDPLRDDGVAYADRLEAAGVDVVHRHYERMIHGFATMLVDPDLPRAREAIADAGADLRASFER
ncbi:alpha/beta hydrolase [Halomontanus rarus]|uniref:alpha/beta hydrolase n=1 Tax=Halomontanus rarus TaxID=3034020 RepID=UPI0023E8E122|nr:alpha/beta hydrolase [Halovivax sp. TS33]